MPNKTERDNYMIGILKELYKTQKFAEFYTDGETDVFQVGNIVALSDDMFAFRAFSINGDQIGVVAYSVNRISQIQTETKYIEKSKSFAIGTIMPIYQRILTTIVLCNLFWKRHSAEKKSFRLSFWKTTIIILSVSPKASAMMNVNLK